MNQNILLLEIDDPHRKYPPLGLMKIAEYHGPRGKGDRVRFARGCDRSLEATAWARIYVTTLFSFEFAKVAELVDFALRLVSGDASRVFVGGIAASLMTGRFEAERRWSGVRFIPGLLSGPPAAALRLDDFSEELYAEDVDGTPIEDLPPDYGILDQVAHRYAVSDAYFAYASRGCVRSCRFCGVPRLEGAQRDARSLADQIGEVARIHGERLNLLLMDNNVVASPGFRRIVDEIVDLGFGAGATLRRPGERRASARRVDFNQGVDARILSRDASYLAQLARTCIRPLRIAFDHVGLRKPYETSVRMAADVGISQLSNYMLYNYQDGPSDLWQRTALNREINASTGLRIYSFPMRYQPTDRPDRGHVGPRWDRYRLRSIQIVLQATQGVVSGDPSFFDYAFGDSEGRFDEILSMPHRFVFHRSLFEGGARSGERDEWAAARARLSPSERDELLAFLSAGPPSGFAARLGDLPANLARVARHHVPPTAAEEAALRAEGRAARRAAPGFETTLTEGEAIEDAGLRDDEAA